MNVNNDLSVQSVEVSQYHAAPERRTYEGTSKENQESNSDAMQSFVDAIEKANYIENGNTECQFSIHKGTNQVMIKIVDQTTKEVIKEIPSEKILDMVAKMCDLAGVFVDRKG